MEDLPAAEDVDWARIEEFVDLFTAPDFSPGATKRQQDPATFPFYAYSPDVVRFVQTMYDIGGVEPFPWAEWHDRAQELTDEPEQLDGADLDELRKLLTTHIRLDRFSEGHLAAMLEQGHIQRALRRIRDLHRRTESSD